MERRWKHVVSLGFGGEPYDETALDPIALQEILKYSNVVSETARSLWFRDHPDRERVPVGFTGNIVLYLRQIDIGSTIAAFEAPSNGGLFDEPNHYLSSGVHLTQEVFEAIEKGHPLPSRLMKTLIPKYQELGSLFKEDQFYCIQIPGSGPAIVSSSTSQKLESYARDTYADFVDVTGSVMEVDIRRNRFEVWLDNCTSVKANFTKDQERKVTSALQDHRETKIHIIGKGNFDDSGNLIRITEVDFMEIAKTVEASYDAKAESVWDMMRRLASEVPPEEWEKFPKDMNENLDAYLYGDKQH